MPNVTICSYTGAAWQNATQRQQTKTTIVLMSQVFALGVAGVVCLSLVISGVLKAGKWVTGVFWWVIHSHAWHSAEMKQGLSIQVLMSGLSMWPELPYHMVADSLGQRSWGSEVAATSFVPLSLTSQSFSCALFFQTRPMPTLVLGEGTWTGSDVETLWKILQL